MAPSAARSPRRPQCRLSVRLGRAGGRGRGGGPRGRRTWPIEAFFVDYLTRRASRRTRSWSALMCRGHARARPALCAIARGRRRLCHRLRRCTPALGGGSCAAISRSRSSCGRRRSGSRRRRRQLVRHRTAARHFIANVAQAYVAASRSDDDIGQRGLSAMLIPARWSGGRRACIGSTGRLTRERPKRGRPRRGGDETMSAGLLAGVAAAVNGESRPWRCRPGAPCSMRCATSSA